MSQGDLPRQRISPSSGQGLGRSRMMGISKRSCLYHRFLLSQKPCNTVDPGQFHTFLFIERRKYRWQPVGDHRLSCPLCSDKKNVMKAGSSDHCRPLSCLLSENVRKVLLVFLLFCPFHFLFSEPFLSLFSQNRKIRDSPMPHLCMFYEFCQTSHSQDPDSGKFPCF